MSKEKAITLSVAHKIKTLMERGNTQQQVAGQLGISQQVVSNVLSGKGMLRQRQLADNMEAFLGGVIVGEGNTRSFAEDGSYEDDTSGPRRSLHPLGETWENGQRVLPTPDVLALLLAEEDLIQRLTDAGIDPDEIMIVDHESDVEEGCQMGGVRTFRHDVHTESWDEFMARAERDVKPGGNLEALKAKRLETEGAEVCVWAVRDIDFDGWPTQPWYPGLTNDTHYRKRQRS